MAESRSAEHGQYESHEQPAARAAADECHGRSRIAFHGGAVGGDEALRDCVADWLLLPSVELARALVWDVLPLRSDRLCQPEAYVSAARLYNSVRTDAARYERGRMLLLSRLVRS